MVRESEWPGVAVGSPSGVDGGDGEEMWYRPGWGEICRLIGWRWVSVVPVLAIGAGVILEPGLSMRVMVGAWKFVILLVALPVVVVTGAWRNALKKRKEPFCIHCGYGLTGLPDGHRCPECGRVFSLAVVEEYRRDPVWFVERYRMQKRTPVKAEAFAAGVVRRRKRRDGAS